MSALLIETAPRSLLVALVVLGWDAEVHGCAMCWPRRQPGGGVLAAAIADAAAGAGGCALAVAACSQRGVVLPADPMTLLEELRATLESRRARCPQAVSKARTQLRKLDSPQIEEIGGAGALSRASGLSRLRPRPNSNPETARPVGICTAAAGRSPDGCFAGNAGRVALPGGLSSRCCAGCSTALGLPFVSGRRPSPSQLTMRSQFVARDAVAFEPAVASPVTIGSAVVLPANYQDVECRETPRCAGPRALSHSSAGFLPATACRVLRRRFLVQPAGLVAQTQALRSGRGHQRPRRIERSRQPIRLYAQILLEFAAAPRPTLIGVAMARSGRLSQRIERLLNDHSFRQAFAGTRRRALLAVLLVPAALFAAMALVRVQAAGQAQQEPAPAPQAAPAALAGGSCDGAVAPGSGARRRSCMPPDQQQAPAPSCCSRRCARPAGASGQRGNHCHSSRR